MESKVHLPPQDLFKGEIGTELFVLTRSKVRTAEREESQGKAYDTIDGVVNSEIGDFIVKTNAGEQYPVRSSVYYGTYEVIGKVGNKFIGKRLVHVRRVWPIVSNGAEFDYGPQKGVVYGQKGGWIYQSDNDDYGLISKDKNEASHVVVGTAAELTKRDWLAQFNNGMRAISFLTPILALVALLAFGANLSGHLRLSTTLLATEAFLLLTGLGLAGWMKSNRWQLKAAVQAGRKIASDFQIAIWFFGYQPSDLFPEMALWRAAQVDDDIKPQITPENIRQLNVIIDATIFKTEHEISKHKGMALYAKVASWASAIAILFCIGIAMITHSPIFEAIAIWLPSFIGSLHTTVWRSQVMSRVPTTQLFLSQLKFVRKQLILYTNGINEATDMTESKIKLLAILKILCRLAAMQSQMEITNAMAQHPEPPS